MSSLATRARNFIYWRYRRLKIRAVVYTRIGFEVVRGVGANRSHESQGPQGLDPRIDYPCYRSFDEFVDIDRLRALDERVTDRVRSMLHEGRGHGFYTGPFKRGLLSSWRPGSTVIPMTVRRGTQEYFDLSNGEFWTPTKESEEFGPLMDFIKTLPFRETARILIIADLKGRATTGHRDHARVDQCHEFMWIRLNKKKPFWVEDTAGMKRAHVESYTAWFDTVNQFHGGDATGALSISIRVDGHFTDEFRAQIPETPTNPASRAALWACVG